MSAKGETIEEEKIKEISLKVEGIDFSLLVEIFSSLLDSYGDFALSIGRIQRDNQEAFEAMLEIVDLAPKMMERFVTEFPPETLALFLRIFVKMPTIFSKLDRLMELEPEEKIKLGTDLKELANDFRKLKEELGDEG